MRGPSLQKTAALSFTLHLTAFIIVSLVLSHSNHMVMPVPYTVSLVSPEVFRGIDKGKEEDVVQESKEPAVKTEIHAKNKKENMKETARETAREKELIEKKISALAAKKKIEKLVKLRSIISLKARGDKRISDTKTASPSTGKYPQPDYSSKIMDEIQPYFDLPPGIVINKGLEAIVVVRILKDGTVIVQEMEKKSGNALFDRSALRALTKASPLTPPPNEMEIGVRFYP